MIDPYIILEEKGLIVASKPAGMPVQPDKSKDGSLLSNLESKLNDKFHLVNRLDRPVSGITVLTADKKVYNNLKNIWHSERVIKSYLAFVEGNWVEEKGELSHSLSKGRGHKAIEHPKGKLSKLTYRKLLSMERYTLLEIAIHTGRFHQIRAQLSISGHPIKGDVKYGARRKNRDRSIHLHCHKISIPDYSTFIAPIPDNDTLWKAASELFKNSV